MVLTRLDFMTSRVIGLTFFCSAGRVPSHAGQTDNLNLRSTRRGSAAPANGTRSAATKSCAAVAMRDNWPSRFREVNIHAFLSGGLQRGNQQ